MLEHRSAVILRPRAPFLEWCKATDDENNLAESVVETMREEPTLYLIDEFDDERPLKENLGAFWEDLFEALLPL